MGQRCGLRMILKFIILSATYSCSCSIICTRHNWSRADPWAASFGLILSLSAHDHSSPLQNQVLETFCLSHPPYTVFRHVTQQHKKAASLVVWC
ncbi:hypothetical protein QBC32DRAFT_342357, partial [Pseudoneurospora amorphoporcata]